jgi:hypothetical protein
MLRRERHYDRDTGDKPRDKEHGDIHARSHEGRADDAYDAKQLHASLTECLC